MRTLSIGNIAALWYTLPLMNELYELVKACNAALLASQSCHMHGFTVDFAALGWSSGLLYDHHCLVEAAVDLRSDHGLRMSCSRKGRTRQISFSKGMQR